ncbi:HAD family hydrolase [Rhodocaloribacter sp.]
MGRTSNPPLPPPEAVVFDLDGVLIDSEPLHEEAERIVFAARGLEVPPSVFREIKGRTTREAFAHLFRACDADGLDVDALIEEKRRLFLDLLRDVRPIPGALAFVRKAAGRGLPLGLTTSSDPATLRMAFDAFALDPFFDAVVTAADVTRAKPDPEPYRLTTERLGARPARTLVIEDSTNGVRSAARAGCRVAGLTTSFDAEALREAGAHLTVASFDELARRLGW